MTYQELYELVESPTIQRDLQYLEDTGEIPAGYSEWEILFMKNYLNQ